MTFSTRKDQVNLAPGQTLGFKRGRGYYAKGTALPYEGYVSPDQLAEQARTQAAAAYDPILRQMQAERTAALAENQRRAQAYTLAANAAAQLARGAGSEVAGIYNQGAQTQGAFARGYSDALQHLQQQGADSANAQLGAIGAPEGQYLHPGAEASDVLFSLGGALPGTNMIAKGVGFGGLAALQPGIIASRGMENFHQQMGKGDELMRDYASQIQKLLAGEPQYTQGILGQLQDRQDRARALYAQQQQADREWQLKQQGLAFNRQLAQARLGLEGERVNVSKYDAKTRRASAQSLDLYRQSQVALGQRNLAVAQQRADAMTANARSAAEKAQAARVQAQVKAQATAQTRITGVYKLVDSWYSGQPTNVTTPVLKDGKPVTDRNGKPITTTVTTAAQRLDYQAAYRRLRSMGLNGAQSNAVLNTVYKRGERNRPWLDQTERNALKKAGLNPTVYYDTDEQGTTHPYLNPNQYQALIKAGFEIPVVGAHRDGYLIYVLTP